MKLSGYWFCEGRCDDTVILPLPRGRAKPGPAKCPQCHQITAVWKPGVPEGVVRANGAAPLSKPQRSDDLTNHGVPKRWRESDHDLFEEMRSFVNAAPGQPLGPMAK